MAERNPSRPWTEEEDSLLTNAVQIYGEQENWKKVAILVPGRTNKACRKRWLHSLSPTIKKCAWTAEEDDLLVSLYNIHGSKWSTIARDIPGRTDDACSKRYREALDPALKKDEWTPEEDKRLMELYDSIGGKWGQVGQELQRSGLGCRNRHRLLSKRQSRVFYDPLPNEMFETSEAPTPATSQTTDFTNWTLAYPYYPPEAYPCFSGEEDSAHHRPFRSPTPDVPHITPDVAPFQFSSSSLCAALSATPQVPEPLPVIYTESGPPSPLITSQSDGNGVVGSSIDQTTKDDFPINFTHSTDLSQIFLGVHFDDNGIFQYPESENATSTDINVAPVHEAHQWSPIMAGSIASPVSAHGQLGTDLSSTHSTPYDFPLSLSGSSSPNPSPIDISANEQHPNFLGTQNRRSPRIKSRKGRNLVHSEKPLRLSSSLTLTSDSSILPYACGRELCWPLEAAVSSACFATSGELLEHTKIVHAADMRSALGKPYRCALAGCGKSWKNLNGLQYHLQLSTAHYQTALSSTFSQSQSDSIGEPPSAPESDSEATNSEDNPRLFGHPPEQPAQLSTVPPALARQLPSKTRKMQRKIH
ncbi:hypothetical protein H2248_000466 [Termitomyces sp. 'cryptogamus']|nr:hypothetical protein H2248_000466 [Termitomyces sp. 'cryptogamus']